MDNFPKVGDTGEQQESDWVLSGESPTLMEKIKKLPTIDDENYWRDQYNHKRHITSCTKFAYYNQWCTIFNSEWSYEEIDKVEDKSIEMGWKWPGYGWSSSLGADAVRKTLGYVSKWMVYLWSDAWKELIKRNRPIGISISVDSDFRKQAKAGKLTSTVFARKYGHADTIKSKVGHPGVYEMIDSVHRYKYDITQEQLDELLSNHNVRWYGYVLLPNDLIDLPDYSWLPQHITEWDVSDNDAKAIISAWKYEAMTWIQNGWELNYTDYTNTYAVNRMLIDLAMIRAN